MRKHKRRPPLLYRARTSPIDGLLQRGKKATHMNGHYPWVDGDS